MLLFGVDIEECLVPMPEFLYDYLSEVLRIPLTLLFIVFKLLKFLINLTFLMKLFYYYLFKLTKFRWVY